METTSDVPQVSVRYGGFWVRFAARIIDGFVISFASMVIIIPLSIMFGVFAAMDKTHVMEILARIVTTIVGMIIGWGYYIFMTHKYQATLGKMAVGARVVAEDGQPLTLGSIILRETIGKLVSGITLCVGYIMVGFTSKKQGLHDMIAKSVVVYTDEGPRKIVVGSVFAFYALIIFFLMCIFGLLAFLGIMAYEGSQQSNGDTSGEQEWQDFKSTIDEDVEPLLKEISDDQASVM
ncbi:MAG: RDD family protein [Parcubacteria group bacterium]|jgi:uncharacterized RDD family membrane protein YckC